MNTLLRSLLPALFVSSAGLGQTISDPSRAATVTDSRVLLREQAEASASGLERENAFAPSSPGDSDLGQQIILKRPEQSDPFSASLDASLFWTDNAANIRDGATNDWLFASGVNVGWQQRIAGRFHGDAFLGEHFYRYDRLGELDYENAEASVGLLIVMPELANTILHVHYYYQNITQGFGDSPVYDTHNIRIGAQKTFLIDRINSVNLSYMSSFALAAEPSELRRHEHSFQASYHLKFSPGWSLDLSYRLAYYDYFNLEGREDWFHQAGAAVTWRASDNLELSAGYYFMANRSSIDYFSYDSQLTGPSVILTFKF